MGRKLRPFCLEYQFWLQVYRSPLVTGEQVISVADLEIASLICTSDYGQAKFIPDQHAKRHWWNKAGFFLKHCRRDLLGEVAAFVAYVQDWSTAPDSWVPEAAMVKATTGNAGEPFPSVLSVAAVLMNGGFEGGRREAIWMCPVGEAHWWATALQRARGEEVNVKTPHDREFEEGLRKKYGDRVGDN